MNCRNCEDTGYMFDTEYPCHECDLGKPVAYERDKAELKFNLARANTLRVKILTYENTQPDFQKAYLTGVVSPVPKLKGLERA